jgi:DNA-binding transcriptional regulator LsrR (DeoR family)
MVADKREKKKVVVIAGSLKQEAIRAALNAQLFNVWITDQDAAQWVLENA